MHLAEKISLHKQQMKNKWTGKTSSNSFQGAGVIHTRSILTPAVANSVQKTAKVWELWGGDTTEWRGWDKTLDSKFWSWYLLSFVQVSNFLLPVHMGCCRELDSHGQTFLGQAQLPCTCWFLSDEGEGCINNIYKWHLTQPNKSAKNY